MSYICYTILYIFFIYYLYIFLYIFFYIYNIPCIYKNYNRTILFQKLKSLALQLT